MHSSASSVIDSDFVRENSILGAAEPHTTPMDANHDFITPQPSIDLQPAINVTPSNTESPTTPDLSTGNTSTTNGSSFRSVLAHFRDTNDSRSNSSDNEPSGLSPDAWLETVVPCGTTPSPLKQHSIEFTLQILRTWPRMMASTDQYPPIFHCTHLRQEEMAEPLARCYTIAKMWHDQSFKSAAFVHEITIREMTNLFQNVCKISHESRNKI